MIENRTNELTEPLAEKSVVAPDYNMLAIIAFVAAFIVPVAAIVIGHLALGQIRQTKQQGRGLSLASVVLGYSFTAISLVLFSVWAIIFFQAISMSI